MIIGALEAGGTKMVCAIGNEKGEIFERAAFATATPELTMPGILTWFRERRIEALGIGCFGPLDLERRSPTYGFITTTPKVAWRGFAMVDYFRGALKTPGGGVLPVGFDTDVNAACLGEAVWGGARDVDSSIYITVGTGIGVGIMVAKRLLQGMPHPEAGHILLARAENDDYPGCCPYHQGADFCLEGLASGPAIAKRWGGKGEELSGRREVWELEALYLAKALVNYILILAPERIILGGGVMKQERLYGLIRKKTAELLNGYVPLPDLERYIVHPALGDDQGIMGCLKLAWDCEPQVLRHCEPQAKQSSK